MGEEAFEEILLISDRGAVFVRGGYGRRCVWLGLSRNGNAPADPDVVVKLSRRMTLRLIAALDDMTPAGDEDDSDEDGGE